MATKSIEQVIPVLEENGFLKSKWAVEEFKANMAKMPGEMWLSNGRVEFKFILDNSATGTYKAHNFRRTKDKALNEMIDQINN